MENLIQKPKKQMLNYINVFRGLAILLIVAGHTMQFGNENTLLNKVVYEILTGGTALFIFISGFLFQHLSAKYEYKNYLSKKWTNVILPYLITAIPGVILCFALPTLYGNPFDGLNPIAQIGAFLTTGRVHNVPTWYIPMICIYFLLADVFIKLDRNNLLYKAMPIMFLITFFIPRMAIEPEYLVNMTYFEKWISYLLYILNGFIHFMFLYVLGMWFSGNKDKIEYCYKWRWLLIFLMLSISVLDVYLNMTLHISNNTISKIFLTLIVLAYLKHYDEKIISNEKLNKTLDFIAKYSFSLFFIHWYVFFAFNQIFSMEKVLPVNLTTDIFGVIVIVVLRFFTVTGVSLLLLVIVKKLLNKFKIENTRSIIGI